MEQALTCPRCGKHFHEPPSRIAAGRGKYCSRECSDAARGSEAHQVAQFWAKVDTSGGPDACWPWTAGLSPGGYGKVRMGRRHMRANRVAYELTKGPLGELFACHTCDNPACCNPAHLYAGTERDNSADMVRRGRAFRRPLGAAKLSDSKAAEIRQRAKVEKISQRALGQIYGVTQATIGRLLRGESWPSKL